MAGTLSNIRPQLIERCNEVLIGGLLDDLLQINILNSAEVEYIIEKYPVRADKYRALIDTVIKKGDYSCNVLLQKIIEKDRKLSEDLGIPSILIQSNFPLPTQEQKRNDAHPIQTAPLQLPLPKQEQSSQKAPLQLPLSKHEQSSQKAPLQLPLLKEEHSSQKAPLQLPLQKEEQSSQKDKITLSSEAEYQEIIKTKETEIYPIRDKCNRKRLALIICNVKFEKLNERKGADVDLMRMKELLEGLDYNVVWKKNLTAEEMRTTMKIFAADSDHKDSDSTFLVFMSHGERDIICGTDFKKENIDGQERVTGDLHVDYIFNTFNNVKCPRLRDKPKVIIIQACRGNCFSRVLVNDSTEQSPIIKQEDLEDDAMRVTLKEVDFICFCSSTPDTVSFRHPEKGSLFIQCLIDVIKKDAHNSSVEDIFKKVQRLFKDGYQMPTQERNTLIKNFFLFPGY